MNEYGRKRIGCLLVIPAIVGGSGVLVLLVLNAIYGLLTGDAGMAGLLTFVVVIVAFYSGAMLLGGSE